MKTESRIQVAANTVKEKYKSPACVISPGSWLLNSKPKPQSGSRQSEDIFILFKKKWALKILIPSPLKVKVTQACPTLCDPMDCIVQATIILQATILEWLAFPFSRGASQPRNQTALQADSLPTDHLHHSHSPNSCLHHFTSGLLQVSLLVHVLLFLPLSNTFLLRYKSDHVMFHLKSLNALSVDSQQKEYLLIIYNTRTA